ncbi:transposase [Vibrio splendidus]|uniref:Transposase n=1 Tax=Vibrio splendidus TaxID=29497 RepID=A0AB35N5E6_VIBSP|nr:transposase [Vibrio splendidus]MDP2503798.1 transposase [Vibrio splendidus]PMG52416.1 hypothetical protein BCU89_03590 [Vibrio splendidus]
MTYENHKNELVLLQALLADKDKQLNEFEATILTLRQSLGDSESNVLTLRQSLNESELTIQSLVEKLNLARRKRFGSSSETMPPQDLEFNEAETHADTTGGEATSNQNDETSDAKNTSSEPKRRGRPKLPEDLPRERVVVDFQNQTKSAHVASRCSAGWDKAPVKNWCISQLSCTLKSPKDPNTSVVNVTC